MPFLRTGYSGKFKILLLRRMEKRLQIFALEGQPEGIRSELDGGMVKLLLKKNKSERVAVTLPQTGEKGTAVLILNKDKGGQIELMDFTRENA